MGKNNAKNLSFQDIDFPFLNITVWNSSSGGRICQGKFPHIPQTKVYILLSFMVFEYMKDCWSIAPFFIQFSKSPATAVIKPTKWISNKQKCHISSRDFCTEHSPYPLPKPCSTVGCMCFQSNTVMPLGPKCFASGFVFHTCNCYIRKVFQ